MFSEVLEGLVSRLEDAQGAAVVGIDGIAIEQSRGASIDLERVAAECTSLIKAGASTGQALEQGQAREILLQCEGAQTLLRSVTPDYFLCLILGPQALVGQARFELRKACHRLENDLT